MSKRKIFFAYRDSHAKTSAQLEGGIHDRLIRVRGHEEMMTPYAAEIIVAVGGDGTVLRAVKFASDYRSLEIPVMGVNYGTLGYLTMPVLDAEKAFAAWDAKTLIPRKRPMIRVRFKKGKHESFRYGFNDVVFHKDDPGHVVRMMVSRDGRFFHEYSADALIFATPTGSTAYGLGAGGPIIDPAIDAISITPVAPHGLFNRTVVVNKNSTLAVTVVGETAAQVIVDGRTHHVLENNEQATVDMDGREVNLIFPYDALDVVRSKFMNQ